MVRENDAGLASVYAKLALVAIIWGGTFVAGRYISAATPALLSASVRFILASLVLAVFLKLSGRGLVRLRPIQFFQILGLGASGIFAYNVFFFYGLQHTPASRASLIVAMNPALMALFAFLFFRERLSALKGLGIALCLTGAMTVILSRSPQALGSATGTWAGDLLMLGCVLSWVAYSVFCRGILRDIGPLHAVTYSIWAGTILLTATAILTGQMTPESIRVLSPGEMFSLTYLGAIGSALAYIWYYDGIRQIGSTRAGVFIALNPLTAVLLGATLLGETLTASMLAGGALVIAGIVISNRPERSATTQ